jgi:hypothetical protein
VISEVYVIKNVNLHAFFLARFIAKQLAYGHRLKPLLNPLKREFKRVMGFLNRVKEDKKKKFQIILLNKRIKLISHLIFLLLFAY